MRTLESLGLVVVVVVFFLFELYVVRELGLLRADVDNVNAGLSELRRESYRVADLQTSNAELKAEIASLMSNISNLRFELNVLTAFALASHDEVELVLNHSLGGSRNIVIVTSRPTGTPSYNIPEHMKEIQNLSSPDDYWSEFCFQERRTNTTLCYRKAE